MFFGGLDLDLRCPSCNSGQLVCIANEHCYMCLEDECRMKHEIDAVVKPAQQIALNKLAEEVGQ